MVYGCTNQMIKLFVFISNLLIFLLGGLIFGVSLWANLDSNFSDNLSRFSKLVSLDEAFVDELAQYQASLWILVAVGAVLLLVGFLGCCGAICENHILLTLFFIIVLILSFVELFTLIFMFGNRGELLASLHQVLVKSSETGEGIKNLFPIEQAFSCCGATIETAYKYQEFCTGKLANAPDCYSVISGKLESMSYFVLAVGCILLVVQTFSMFLSCVLSRAFRERGPAYYA